MPPKKPTTKPTADDTEKKAGPTFELKSLGTKKPESDVSAKGPRRTQLVKNLRAIQDNPGEWFEVSQYATASGATNVLKALVNGKWELPEGDGEYDLDAVRRNVDGKRVSVLVACFITE